MRTATLQMPGLPDGGPDGCAAAWDRPPRTPGVDNQDLFRHTFTIPDTDGGWQLHVDVGVRVPLDLEPGVYEVACEVPGHDFMTTTLQVQ